MKDYSIHLTELFAGHITVYNNVTLGSNVKAPLKKTTAHGNTIRWKELNLSEMEGGFAYITTTTSDLHAMLHNHNIVLIDSSEGSMDDRCYYNKSEMSGIVVLSVLHLNKYRRKVW